MRQMGRLSGATFALALAAAALAPWASVPVRAQAAAGGASDVAAEAAAASEALRAAVVAMSEASSGREQVAALTATIRGYEEGLAALREALRQAELREAGLQLRFMAKREKLGQLLTVLARIEQNAAPLLLLHPEGPVGMARSGMILSDVTPALNAEAEALRADLQELADLRSLQRAAGKTLGEGLSTAQNARTALSKAISERGPLPKRFEEDADRLRAMLESADTLDAFAAGLALSGADSGLAVRFITAMGLLPLPAMGRVIRGPEEADPAGVRRPGFSIATRRGALVTAPWPATIRYLGPLLDYGNVIIIEPGDGYLLILAGLGTVYGEVGEVVAAGDALGLMGGTDAALSDGGAGAGETASGTGASETETLYLELRLGAAPVDPIEWFAATASIGD